MIVSWMRGEPRAGQPVAVADARVAGVLAAADLQLRRDPTGRRQSLRVRRARRSPRRPERRPRRRSRRRSRSERESNRTLSRRPSRPGAPHPRRRQRDGRRQGAARGARASAPPRGRSASPWSRPQNEPRAGYVVYEDSRRSSAERRLRRTLDLLHEAGIAARGRRRRSRSAAGDSGRDARVPPVDEVIISTHPGAMRSSWLRGGPRRARAQGGRGRSRSSTSWSTWTRGTRARARARHREPDDPRRAAARGDP